MRYVTKYDRETLLRALQSNDRNAVWWPDELSEREMGHPASWTEAVKGMLEVWEGMRPANNPPRTRKGAEAAIDKAISHAWAQLMSGVQVPIMDIPRIFRDIKLEMAGGADLETAVRAVGGRYRVNRNPRGRMCEHGSIDQRRCRGCRTRKHARRRTALCPHGISGGKIGRDCVRCVEKRYGYKPNGSGARKVTMPIEKFARLVKAQNDPALWRDFVAKCKAYHKWSHGTWPKKATIEAIRKPGMKGMWISFDMGREPEKTYVMPSGTKRKGAWNLAADAAESLREGRIVRWDGALTARTIADGTRSQAIGRRPFAHLSRLLDGVITVGEAEIAAAVRLAAEESRLVVEPSGALTIAAARFHGRELGLASLAGLAGTVVAVVSGGNVDPARYRELLASPLPG